MLPAARLNSRTTTVAKGARRRALHAWRRLAPGADRPEDPRNHHHGRYRQVVEALGIGQATLPRVSLHPSQDARTQRALAYAGWRWVGPCIVVPFWPAHGAGERWQPFQRCVTDAENHRFKVVSHRLRSLLEVHVDYGRHLGASRPGTGPAAQWPFWWNTARSCVRSLTTPPSPESQHRRKASLA